MRGNKVSNLLSLAFLCLMISSCGESLKINKKVFNSYIQEEKSIVISCVYCGCITDFLKTIRSDSSFNGVAIYADTICIMDKLPYSYKNLPQVVIDSIFPDNYNAILFYRKNNHFSSKLLKTESSEDFSKIITAFFK